MSIEYLRQMISLGQIANRSPLILADDMEDLLKWAATGNEAGYALTKDNTLAFNGDYSLKLVTRSDGAAEDDYIEISRTFPILPNRIVEASFKWHCADLSLVKALQTRIIFDNGDYAYQAGVQFTTADAEFEIETDYDVFETIPDTARNLSVNAWHELKVVLNFTNLKYMKIRSDDQIYDVSDYDIFDAGSGHLVYGAVTIKVTTAGAAAATVNIDDFLITSTELP
jgi:hypothetical protein